jgi:uncharacterized protein YndB with AHSA1/START domain
MNLWEALVEHVSNLLSAAGTPFVYYDDPPTPAPDVNINGDLCLHTRLYTYRTGNKLVAGWTMSVTFVIERAAMDVWPHLKDFNPWQNAYGHYYTGVVGDLEGKSFRIGKRPDDPESFSPYEYNVLKVIPEQLIVISQPIPTGGRNGGVSPGFHVFMLNEYDAKTTVTVLMDHATGTDGMTEDEALAPWREFAPEAQRKWREIFVPELKMIVYGA